MSLLSLLPGILNSPKLCIVVKLYLGIDSNHLALWRLNEGVDLYLSGIHSQEHVPDILDLLHTLGQKRALLARVEKAGDIPAIAIPLEGIPMRGHGIRDIHTDKEIKNFEIKKCIIGLLHNNRIVKKEELLVH